jgi:hypothetical protein
MALTVKKIERLGEGRHHDGRGLYLQVTKSGGASSLQTYAFDQIGKLPVAKIDTTVVLEVLKPIWYAKTVTAGLVRNRIESVLDWCTASGYRTGPNPAAWSGHLEAILPAKSEITKVEHHRALPFEDIPNFMEALASRKGFNARAMEFLVLCAGRTSEIKRTSQLRASKSEKGPVADPGDLSRHLGRNPFSS